MKAKIIAHCLVKNEERFIWYALNSVLPYVEKIMVWDTGSTDNTINIIRSINDPKIDFKQINPVDATGHTTARQQMLDATDKTKFDWLMILDGDEIWTSQALSSVSAAMSDPQVNTLVVHSVNFVGDIYHRLPESAGQYQIGEQRGHLNLRFIRLSIPDLQVINPHGGQTYTSHGKPVQNQKPPELQILDTSYFHATHLIRSRQDNITLKRSLKFKLEIGSSIPRPQLPQLFFLPHPQYVPDVTQPMSPTTYTLSLLLTLPRRLKRLLLPSRSGY